MSDIPKDGRLYWFKPRPEDASNCHYFRSWDAANNRYQDYIEPAGIQPILKRTDAIPEIPPRHDGTILREGVGYEKISIE